MVIPFYFPFKFYSPQLTLFQDYPILNSAVSEEVLQVAFSFQNSVKLANVGIFFNFKLYVLQMRIETMISFSEQFKKSYASV